MFKNVFTESTPLQLYKHSELAKGGSALEKSSPVPLCPLLPLLCPLPCVDTKIWGAPGGLNCGIDETETIANVMTKNSKDIPCST